MKRIQDVKLLGENMLVVWWLLLLLLVLHRFIYLWRVYVLFGYALWQVDAVGTK